MRKEVSRVPWETVKGRREAEDRGVDTPVWAPVPVPYMVKRGGIVYELYGYLWETVSGEPQRLGERLAQVAAHNLGLFVSKILEILSQEQRVQNSIAVNTQWKEGWRPHEAKMLAH